MGNSHYWHLDFLCLEQYAHTEISPLHHNVSTHSQTYPFYEVILIKPKDDFGNAMPSIEITFKHTFKLNVVPIIPPSVCCSLHPFYMIDNSMNVTFKFLEDIIQSPCENSACTNNSVTQNIEVRALANNLKLSFETALL